MSPRPTPSRSPRARPPAEERPRRLTRWLPPRILLGVELLEDRVQPSNLPTSIAAPLGGMVQVNTYTAGAEETFPQSPEAVAVDSSTGAYIVAWSSQGQVSSRGSWDVYFQRYSAAGVAEGSPTLVDTPVNGDSQEYVAVAMNASGNFVVVWAGNQLGHFNVYAQQYNSSGTAQGSALLVDTSGSGDQTYPTVAMDSSGNFAVSWLGQPNGSPWAIYGREFNSSGVATTAVFQVNTTSSAPPGQGGNSPGSSIAMDPSGAFVITWSSTANSQQDVYAQLYAAGGSAVGSPIEMNPTNGTPDSYSVAAMDSAGDFVIVWQAQVSGGYDIMEQRFDASGKVLGSTFQVNTEQGNNEYPAVAVDGGGNFVVTWSKQNQGTSGKWGVSGQQFFADGIPDGNQFYVSSNTGYDVTVTQGTLSAANYSFTFVNGSISITPATLTVTANNATKVYGQANPTFTDNITGFVNGDTESVVSGTASLTTTATSGSGVGTYAITASLGTLSAANYTFSFVNGTLSITPATLTVAANDLSSVYGEPLPTLTDSISGFVNGDGPGIISGSPSLSTTATAGAGVGSYPITVSQGTLSAANYTFSFVNGTLTITPATLTVTADDGTMTYGGTVPALSDSITGYVNGDGPGVVSGSASLSTTATSSSGVRTCPVTVMQGTLSAANYSFTFVNGAITVTPATLTVTANDAAKVYGQDNPALAATITGFVNGDGPGVVDGSPALTTTATSASSVGDYAILPALGSLQSANYSFAFADGALAVNPATLTVTVDDAFMMQGEPLPDFNYHVEGFMNGDTAAAVGGSPALVTNASSFSPVGSYPITAMQGTLAAANYTFAFVDGTRTVSSTPPVLTVTATNATWVMGQPEPVLTYAITGFVNGDTAAVVSGSPVLTVPAAAGSPAGSYPIAAGPGTLSAAGYTFAFIGGSLTVVPPQKVTPPSHPQLSSPPPLAGTDLAPSTGSGQALGGGVSVTAPSASLGDLSGTLPITVVSTSMNPGTATGDSAPRVQLLPPLRAATGADSATSSFESGFAVVVGRTTTGTATSHPIAAVKAADAVPMFDQPTRSDSTLGWDMGRQKRPVEAVVSFSSPASASDFEPPDSLFAQLDEAIDDIRAGADEEAITNTLVVSGGIAVAGTFLLNTRAVYWFLSALLARPAVWRRFDPLEVIYAWERERVPNSRHPDPAADESMESMVKETA